MSFSSEVKDDLCKLPLRAPHCIRAELAGFLHAGAVLSIGSGGPSLTISSENADTARRAMALISRVYRAPCELSVIVSQPKNKQTFRVRVEGRELVPTILDEAGLSPMSANTEDIIAHITERDCCRSAFLRGAFLGGGSISDPNKSFHMEFLSGGEKSSKIIEELITNFEIKASGIERKGSFVVYLKGGDYIAGLLTHMGAHKAVMDIANIRIMRDIRNNANRQTNCVDANTDKTVRASVKQAEDIRLLLSGSIELPPELLDTAMLRLDNPEASLAELAEMSSLSRSGINHRLKKLSQLAADMRGD